MKKFSTLIFLLGIAGFAVSQNTVNRVLEYKPAPGQHINIESIGTPQAAEKMPESISSIVSLGSFGGYIVLGFEQACVNDPENPYGIDFTIFGNAFSGSSEPGIVWVMKDENKNGQPDDTWYEIKGSQHFQSETQKNYSITYYKTETRDIFWKDNQNNSGTIKANSYNTQEYYPTVEYFPDYPADSVTFTGTLLAPAIDSSNTQQLVIEALDFGYADVHARKQGVALTLPDNPYTTVVEGAGGDPIDISWAVDSNGNYAELDSVHFVKITTGNFASVGWLGEISTDVAYVSDIEKNASLTGENELLIVYHHQPKIITGETLQLETGYFRNGKPLETTFQFVSQNQNVAEVNSYGLVTARNTGSADILVTSGEKSKTTSVEVVAPDSIENLSDFSAVYVGDTILLQTKVFDNNGDILDVPVLYALNTETSGKIIQKDGSSYFIAEKAGETSINFSVEGFVEENAQFQIWSENDRIEVYFTAKTENENLLPLQKINVGLSNLNEFTDNRQNDYSGISRHVLAHAIISGLQKAGVNFVFRDDENSGGKLYLYSVENEGEFTYGWGGKTSPQAFAKAWIARVNSAQTLNNFDKTEIANGDTVVLYHISDIVNPWTFTQMIADKDSAKQGDSVQVLLQQATSSFDGETISESVFSPVSGQLVQAGQNYFSDENGEAEIILNVQPPLVIVSENDAVLINEKIITSTSEIGFSDIKIYPNPVETELLVSGNDLVGKQMYIFDLNGKCIWSESVFTSRKSIDVQFFKSGIYVLKIVEKSGVKTFKFIKK